MPRIVYIDPDAAPGGDGSGRHPFASWSEFTLRNGDIALQRGGTVAAGFTIGPDAQSVTIGSYGTGRARIEGSIVLNGTSGVVLSNLDIAGGNVPAVHLIGGTTASLIQGCDIHGSNVGILVVGDAVAGNVFSDNLIHDNDAMGISFDGVGGQAMPKRWSPTIPSIAMASRAFCCTAVTSWSTEIP